MQKQKGAKILYLKAVKNSCQNAYTQGGAQKLSAQYSLQYGSQKVGAQNSKVLRNVQRG